jgi:ribosomal protein S18 acetylase RimI-like enzyme
MNIVVFEKLTEEQGRAVSDLKKLVFSSVSDEEAEEDFYHPESAHVLAYIGNELVGWAGVHETEQVFEDKIIKLGGYGICTHPDWQRKGIASKISLEAMKFLKENGCDVAFLSVDPANIASVRLHQKNGFVMLPRDYSWTNSKGELKQDSGGMISPVNSQEIFEYILNGKDTLHVGNGYW